MDCKKLQEIYTRSCSYQAAKEPSNSFIFEHIYYQNNMQVKQDANCLKSIKLIKQLGCECVNKN